MIRNLKPGHYLLALYLDQNIIIYIVFCILRSSYCIIGDRNLCVILFIVIQRFLLLGLNSDFIIIIL